MKTVSYTCDWCKEELLHYFFKLKMFSYKIEKDGEPDLWRALNSFDICEKCKIKILLKGEMKND